MRFELLGTLAVIDGAGGRPTVRGPRQRVLLAALLLHAGEPVSLDALADAVWDGSPPSGYAVTLRSHVRQLRRRLGLEAERIAAREPGYLIRVGRDEFDIFVFEDLCAQAEAASRAGAWAEASDAATEALRLWRGAPLLDIPSQVLRDAFAPSLDQLRLQTLEDRIEADLHLGRHHRLVSPLRELAARHPLRERFHAQLMLALARSGRQAEALEAYRDARQVLIDDLGIEPGPELRTLHEEILAGSTAMVAPASETAQPLEAPQQLPAAIGHFVGRSGELKALNRLLGERGGKRGTAMVAVIDGMAGVGKTALAVHWAHQHADRFPDGQLYVNLRGFDPSGTPLAAGSAVRGFLDALAVPAARIPVGLAAQTALYRTRLAGTRTLIVLDNARDAKQVRPLLPGAEACLVLVTSRRRLVGLVAVDGALPLTVGLLPAAEARELLLYRLGSERVSRESRAADDLAGLCAGLPLALNIAAANALTRPDSRLAALAEALHQSTGLGARPRTTSDELADLRAVFSWSYRALDHEAARTFRMLSLHPGPDIGETAAASLTGLPQDQARRVLDQLTGAHLLTEHVPGRYTFHDLLRARAAELVCAHDTEGERREAEHRLLDHFLHTARAAFRLTQPGWLDLDLNGPRPGATAADLADREEALVWYREELPSLRGMVARAADGGFDDHAWKIVWAWAAIMDIRGRWPDLAELSEIALASARRRGDMLGQAFAHRWLGDARAALGSYPEALAHLHQALALYERLGDLPRQANTYHVMAVLEGRRERHPDALAYESHALELFRAAGYRIGEAWALNGIGWYNSMLGNHEQALAHCRQALLLTREIDSPAREAAVLDSLGYAHHGLGHYADAISCYQHAIRLRQTVGDSYYQAETLSHLGDTYREIGDLKATRRAWRQALALFDGLQHPDANALRARLQELDEPRRCP